MRNLESRPALATTLRNKIERQTQRFLLKQKVSQTASMARKAYDHARKSMWFKPVIDNLRQLSGEGELCMYCSSNEPSHVDHYRPLSVFPELALDYENFLWSCDICNRTKGDRFPPDTHKGAQILNPIDDDVWEHFQLDHRFGRLLKKFDTALDRYSPRAESTCEHVGIDRENVQTKRQNRYKTLCRDITRSLADFESGSISLDELRAEIADQRSSPFQADVSDYFLNGPGRECEPFKSALNAIGENVL